jgi:cell division septum initiation protein DivIVA
MGTLTKDMTRLCEEIQTQRAGRHELKKNLAEKTKARQVEVLETRAAFTEARNWKAESAHTTRQNFVDNLKQAVAEQGKSLRDDLATARRVWGKLRLA